MSKDDKEIEREIDELATREAGGTWGQLCVVRDLLVILARLQLRMLQELKRR